MVYQLFVLVFYRCTIIFLYTFKLFFLYFHKLFNQAYNTCISIILVNEYLNIIIFYQTHIFRMVTRRRYKWTKKKIKFCNNNLSAQLGVFGRSLYLFVQIRVSQRVIFYLILQIICRPKRAKEIERIHVG